MATEYIALKSTHLACVVLSYCFFFVRGVWMMRGSPLLDRRWVRILPHVIDTVLLASAIMLAFVLKLNPLATPWLAAKIGGLVLYIVLGTIALRRGRTRSVRLTAWIAALAVFGYIIGVAVTRQAWPRAG